MALKAPQMSACSTSSSSSCVARRPAAAAAAASSTLRSSSRRRVVVAAAADDSVPAAAAPASPPPQLSWPEDNETARDIFAFSGSLPERLNGRMAMLGFAGMAAAELKDHVPAAEQLAGDAIGVLLLSATFLLASLFPKFNTGYSLKELNARATSANLKGDGIAQALALFDTNVELWTGRAAMIGVASLFAVEAVTGKVFF